MSEGFSAGSGVTAEPATPPNAQVARVLSLLDAKNAAFTEHAYFELCRGQQLTRTQIIQVLKQLYCFSSFFERLMSRRVAEYSSELDPRILEIARQHLSEELGHVTMFRECLYANGVSARELSKVVPYTFTKAMFGYLLATIEHEAAEVTNVAMLQVMEGTAQHFFAATLEPMRSHGMATGVIGAHSVGDVAHSALGLELIAEFDESTLADCCRVIEDIYRLMSAMLDDWLAPLNPPAAP